MNTSFVPRRTLSHSGKSISRPVRTQNTLPSLCGAIKTNTIVSCPRLSRWEASEKKRLLSQTLSSDSEQLLITVQTVAQEVLVGAFCATRYVEQDGGKRRASRSAHKSPDGELSTRIKGGVYIRSCLYVWRSILKNARHATAMYGFI